MSPVSDNASESPARPLPKEFAHSALQNLLLLGRTNGSVDSEQLRVALVEAEVEPKRMKTVLRSLEEQGISITLDAATATRAVAATSSARRTASASTKKTAAKKTATKKAVVEEAKPATTKATAKTATKATATKTAAKAATKKAGTTAEATAAAAAPAKKTAAKKTAATGRSRGRDAADEGTSGE